ncbi:Hypothetical predicted protein [Mytilus galloprovincialis]|uniref:Uncharacterized protein n=1 Tax=Mytilus galloprovincialis TaxID=29158 RepID=A0A8B6BWU7_MYTGA|nr:Hypothetical predicted protein [Mytilus galloprovincialis]
MDKQLEYSEIYWENIRHQQQLEILHRKLKTRINDEEDDLDINIEGQDIICKTIPSERDTDQNRRRQIVDQHNTYNNDIYNDRKYDQKQNQQDQQKDWSKRRNSSEVPEHRENNEIITIQEKKKTRQRKQVMYRYSLKVYSNGYNSF